MTEHQQAMAIIGVILGVDAGTETEVPAVEEEDVTLRVEMTETVEETGENINKDTVIIGDKDKIVLPVAVEDSGITITTAGIEQHMGKVTVGERNGTEVKVKVMGIEVGVVDGIHMINTLPRDITQVRIIKIKTTTALRQWDIKHHIQQHHSNTQSTPNNNNTQAHVPQHGHNKQQTFVNYARTLDTMITSVSSLATFCHEHRRHSTKAVRIIIQTPANPNGQLGKMIMKTPMTSLFSKGGSSCR